MKKIALSLVIIFIVSCSSKKSSVNAQVKNVVVDPKGEYKNIDIQLQEKTIETLKSTAEEIISNPNIFDPTVLYNLSQYLFNDEQKDEAAFWFYTAQLRARYDANRCNDQSAKQAVSVLNNTFGPQINKYGFSDIDNLDKIVNKVIQFVKLNKEEYDHRWINRHGMGYFLNDKKELSKPISEWNSIRNETIETYHDGFKKAVNQFKNAQ